jgi:hypothetical protein
MKRNRDSARPFGCLAATLALQGSCSTETRNFSPGDTATDAGRDAGYESGGSDDGGRAGDGDAGDGGDRSATGGQGGSSAQTGAAPGGEGGGGAGGHIQGASGKPGTGGEAESGNDGGAIGAGGEEPAPIPLSLGDPCAEGASCLSGLCVDAVCCETACSELCAECNASGQCVAAESDENCTVFECPTSSSCRTYDSAFVQCLRVGECASTSDCGYTNTPRAQVCEGPADACDGEGNCTLWSNQSPCTSDDSCASGACIDGICGMRVADCADLSRVTSQDSLVEDPEFVIATLPPRQARGGAVLLDGQFLGAFRVCLGSKELTVEYRDGSNAMVVIPSSTALGTHEVTVIGANGKVSKTLTIQVLAEFEPGPTYTWSDQLESPFAIRTAVFVPQFLPTYPPVTNSWLSSDAPNFVASGAPDLDGGTITATMDGDSRWRFIGHYDVAHHRISLTFNSPPGTCTKCSWGYVGIFSCPSPEPLNINGELVDVCAPGLDYSMYWAEGGIMRIPRTVVLFPTEDPFSQVVFGG